MTKVLLNPFERYSEFILLVTGLAITVAGCLLAFCFNVQYDSVFHLNFAEEVPLQQPFVHSAINIISLLLFLYPLGFFINKKTRMVDVAITVFIARGPLYLLTIFNAGGHLDRMLKLMTLSGTTQGLDTLELSFIVVVSIVSLGALVWCIALLYNGFKIAVNLKATRDKVLFALALLLANILSSYLIHLLTY